MAESRALPVGERFSRVEKYFRACGWVHNKATDCIEKGDLKISMEHILSVCVAEDTPQRIIRFLENEIDTVQR